jgi:hypothetical protein
MSETEKTVTIRIMGLIGGGTSAFDGQYVVEYDPGRGGVEPGTGFPMLAHLVTTPDKSKATRYEAGEAFELWKSVDPDNPLRPDGEPNRPLTAFSVEFEG